MNQLTRRQHYVPRFYQAQWSNATGQIICHDLATDIATPRNPKNVLIEDFFYEEDPTAPNNRIENLLSGIESKAAPVFKKVEGCRDASVAKWMSNLKAALSESDLDAICDFVAYQYIRVPGAIEQKEYELQPSGLTEEEVQHALNPGRFVETGFAHFGQLFKTMKMLVLVSAGKEFYTCDWPCFDLKDSDDSPILGEEIGKNPDVACYFPISPSIALLLHIKFPGGPRLHIQEQGSAEVENQNTLIIQKADRTVIASKEDQNIFVIASSRKRGRPAAT